MADDPEDFTKLPLVDRAVHKLWKVRKEAYEAATKSVLPLLSTRNPSSTEITDPCLESLRLPPMSRLHALHHG